MNEDATNVSTKKEKRFPHLGYVISFSIIMALLGVMNFFLTDFLGLQYWAIILSWMLYISFIVFGLVYLRKKKTWIKAVSYLGIFTLAVPYMMGAPGYVTKQAYAWDKVTYTSEVSLKHGKIRGVVSKDGKTNIFTGIPYAKAPIGDLRWKAPVEEEDWEGVKDCIYFAPRAMQVDSGAFIDTGTRIVVEGTYRPDFEYVPYQNMSEDCLYLNVWSPVDATDDMPVLVYIHGGSLTSGSSANDDINGEMLSKRGIVVVTIAYRLNVFGYFAHADLEKESGVGTTGNYGLLDQIRALNWVQDNIGHFHGDKTKVTIAGESAGSSSVSALCVSPLSNGLFRYAIGESSSIASSRPPHTFRTKEKALKMGEDIMEEMGCSTIDELRKIPAEVLVKTSFANNSMMVDGYALPKTPYEIYQEGGNHELALLHGCNLQEGDAFVIPSWLFGGVSPSLSDWKQRLKEEFGDTAETLIQAAGEPKNDYEAYRFFNDIYGAYWFNYQDYVWGKASLASGKDVYHYLFTKENNYMGTWHSGEIIYAYDNLEASKAKYGYRYDDGDVALSKTMASYWANFVKTGNPNGEGLTEWNKDTLENKKVFELGTHLGSIDDPLEKYYNALSTFIPVEKEAE